MKKTFFSGIIIVSLLLSFAQLSFALGKGDSSVNFRLSDLDGKPVDLSSFSGKVIFLDVWASWCVPCAKEMPFLVDAYNKYKDRGFVVIAVSVDEKKKNIKRFFKKKLKIERPDFPVLHDPEKKVPYLYKVRGIPASVIIGKDGKIAFEPRTGFEESHIPEIIEQIEKALAQ